MKTQALISLLAPVPPILEQAFGYPGAADYVAFYWSEVGDELSWVDSTGSSAVGGCWDAWLSFIRHPAIRRYLEPFEFGSSDRTAKHWLLLDRKNRLFYVGNAYDVNAFLVSEQPAGANAPCEMTVAEFDRLASRQLSELNKAIEEWDASAASYEDAILSAMAR